MLALSPRMCAAALTVTIAVVPFNAVAQTEAPAPVEKAVSVGKARPPKTSAPPNRAVSQTRPNEHAKQSAQAAPLPPKRSVTTANSDETGKPDRQITAVEHARSAPRKKAVAVKTPDPESVADAQVEAAEQDKPVLKKAVATRKPSHKMLTRVARHAPADDTALEGEAPAAIAIAAPSATGDVKELVTFYAQRYGVPETLAHRIVIRESRYNPGLMGRGYYGLMQISLPTARQMGYAGAPQGLLDARTNLAHGMPYLANAWIVSGGSEARAVSLYSRGYYYDAKRKGLLRSLHTARSGPAAAQDAGAVAVAQ